VIESLGFQFSIYLHKPQLNNMRCPTPRLCCFV